MQRIVAILVVFAAGGACSVSANTVRIYTADFNLPIPSPDDPYSEYGKGWMQDAVIQIPDHFIIADLDVGITLTHTNVFDLQISLQNPAGTILTLNMYNFDEFFEAENYTNTIFDDEAPLSIKEGEAPFTGRFRPLDVLSDFDGTDAFGSWHLRICDMWEWDTGTFNHLELIFIPEPSTATLLILGAGLLTLFRPHRHR